MNETENSVSQTSNSSRPSNRKIYCVGLFRSGTNTMQHIFKDRLHAEHEFMMLPTARALRDYAIGNLSRTELRDFLKYRDTAKPLEVDSIGIHYPVVDILLDLNPTAKFILTIRDCYSWLNSCIQLLYPDFNTDQRIQLFSELINNIEHRSNTTLGWTDHPRCKVCLTQLMKMWTFANSSVMKRVPAERLLVIETAALNHSLPQIADFVGVEKETLNLSHSHKGDGKNFLHCLDSKRLKELCDHHCGELMTRTFPDATLENSMQGYKALTEEDAAAVHSAISLEEFIPVK